MKLCNVFFIIFITIIFNTNSLPIKKVIIWGHKIHSHTHSYIHYGFFKAFKHLGYDTYWFDNNDNTHAFDFSGSLFITESQVDQNIPLRDDCYYILHNCSRDKYRSLIEKQRCIVLQVYSHDVLLRAVQKLEECIFIERDGIVIYMPWATDLLPYEIDAIKKQMKNMPHQKDNTIAFIGSIGGGTFGNIEQIEPFRKAGQENGLQFINKVHLSLPQTIEVTQSALFAPALQGAWQCKQGYIPCRIFKNISYGVLGITNSEAVWLLFNKKIVYNPDTYQLFYDAQERMKTITLEELHELMDFVRDKHTYINRIETLLWFLAKINQKESN